MKLTPEQRAYERSKLPDWISIPYSDVRVDRRKVVARFWVLIEDSGWCACRGTVHHALNVMCSTAFDRAWDAAMRQEIDFAKRGVDGDPV